ncbi:hypothetical protein AAC387_Pa12g1524 [Persea americana]
MAAGGGGDNNGSSLEYTPTWAVAAVCPFIVIISFVLERAIYFLAKVLKKKDKKLLLETLERVKEELMLLGFMSFLVPAFKGAIGKICVPIHFTHHMLPCKERAEIATATGHCAAKGKVPLLSQEGFDDLDTFIFVLAIVHFFLSLITVILGEAKIYQWKHWEDAIKHSYNSEWEVSDSRVTPVIAHAFIRDHFQGIGKHSAIVGWLVSFFKQFQGSVNKFDYITLRHGFINKHCRRNPNFGFHRYMVGALEDDYKRVVGISWYHWIFVVIFLLLNVHGWNAYFWMAFIPLILLLAVGAKLEHVISQLAHEVAEKHVAIEGDLVVRPSDDHFWFHRPCLVLHLIHFILFQNAFEIAVFFWILITFGFDSCIMGKVGYIIPRLVIGVIVQVVCSYSTLPLYAIVTQMGTSFKKAIFDGHVQEGLVRWAQKAKERKGVIADSRDSPSNMGSAGGFSAVIQLHNVGQKESAIKEEVAGNSDPSNASNGHQAKAP